MDWNPAVGVPLILIGAVVLVLIYLFGRPRKPEQGERRPGGRRANGEGGGRIEPTFGEPGAGEPTQAEFELPGEPDADPIPPRAPGGSGRSTRSPAWSASASSAAPPRTGPKAGWRKPRRP